MDKKKRAWPLSEAWEQKKRGRADWWSPRRRARGSAQLSSSGLQPGGSGGPFLSSCAPLQRGPVWGPQGQGGGGLQVKPRGHAGGHLGPNDILNPSPAPLGGGGHNGAPCPPHPMPWPSALHRWPWLSKVPNGPVLPSGRQGAGMSWGLVQRLMGTPGCPPHTCTHTQTHAECSGHRLDTFLGCPSSWDHGPRPVLPQVCTK